MGSLDENYQSIIPALSLNDKLPRLDAVADLAINHGMAHERLGHWKEAGSTYHWLFEVACQYSPKSFIYKKALAILLSFGRRLSFQYELDVEYRSILRPTGIVAEKNAVDDLIKSADAEALRILRNWPVLSDRNTSTHLPIKGVPAADSYDTPSKTSDILYDKFGPIERRSKISKDARDVFESRPLHYAASEPNEFFSSPQDDERWDSKEDEHSFGEREQLQWTCYHSMASMAPFAWLVELLRTGADPNVRDLHGWTPLHCACFNRNPYDSGSKVSWLIQHHAEVDAQGVDGIAPIHCAAIGGSEILIRILLDQGANVNITDLMGRTSLHYASLYGQINAVRFLLERGADKLQRDHHGRVASHFAARSGQTTTLAEFRDTWDAFDVINWTTVHHAAFHGQESVMTELFNNNSACGVGDLAKRTPLYLAARNGHDQVVEGLLLLRPSDKYVCDLKGFTPLHVASQFGHATTVRLLLRSPSLHAFSRDGQKEDSSLLCSGAGSNLTGLLFVLPQNLATTEF